MKTEPENSLPLNLASESPAYCKGRKRGKKVLKTSLNGIYIHDLETNRPLFINPEYTKLTGYTVRMFNEMTPDDFYSLIHPEDRHRMDDHIHHMIKADNGELVEIEYRLRTADGNWIRCLSKDSIFKRNPDSSVRQIIGSLTDITDRKESEHTYMVADDLQLFSENAALLSTVKELKNQLAESRYRDMRSSRLSSVFMDAADPIIIEDLRGHIIDVNRETEKTYGWSRNELVGEPIRKLIPSEQHESADKLRKRCLLDHEVRHWEGLRQNRSGQKFSVLITAYPLTDSSGERIALATIARDMSKQKRRVDRLKHSRSRHQELSRKTIEALEKDRQSVAKIIHDNIGASLAAIKFNLEEVLHELPKKSGTIHEDIKTVISHLVDTIKETKNLSAGLRPTTLDDLGLLATIDWYIRQFTLENEGIEVNRWIDIQEIDIPESSKIVIYRILQEALTNAAIQNGTDEITVRLQKIGNEMDLEIEYNGKGFDIRKGLNQENLSGKQGLVDMKERVDLCGGSFLVFSRPGQGTRISATLPLVAKAV